MESHSIVVHTIAQVSGLHLGDAVDERVQPLVLGAAFVALVPRAPAAAHEVVQVRARVAQTTLEHTR